MIYLKFDNELQMKMVLADYMTRKVKITVDEETGERTETKVGPRYFIGPWNSLTHGLKAGEWELWVRGILHAPTGETTTDEEGNTVALTAPLTGFHVDLDPKLGAHDIEGWLEKGFLITPDNPQFRK